VFTAEMWCLEYKGGVYSTRVVFTAQWWCLQSKERRSTLHEIDNEIKFNTSAKISA